MIDVTEDAFPLVFSSTPCREITNTCVWIGATMYILYIYIYIIYTPWKSTTIKQMVVPFG